MEALVSSRLALALTGLTVLLVIKYLQTAIQWRARTKGRPLPPGPKGLPIVGNYFDIPKVLPWERYRDMSKQYGDLMHFYAMGQHLLVVNSAKAAFDLLEKRSAKYSDRPQTIIWKILGNDWFFAFMPYGGWWRMHRREFFQQFHPGTLKKYDVIQQQEVNKFLNRLVDDPKKFKDSLAYMSATIILRIVYNIDIQKEDDPIITAMEDAMQGQKASILPGLSLADFIPSTRFWPSYGKRLASYHAASYSMRDLPYHEATVRPDSAEHVSVVQTLQERASRGEETDPSAEHNQEILVKNVAGIAYGAAGETTNSTVQSFFLAMSLYPDVQKRAQAEIDATIGHDRLPNGDDRDELPFVSAMIKELLRWHTVTPAALPHAGLEDDEYEGYFIPAGTVIFANAWAMLHDPAVYPDPMAFRPDRFLKDGARDPNVPDPALFAFGFGRRICPGRHFAERSIFIVVSSILSTFDISPPLDENGKTIHIEPQQMNSHISFPVDCGCTIKPRSEAAVQFIRRLV